MLHSHGHIIITIITHIYILKICLVLNILYVDPQILVITFFMAKFIVSRPNYTDVAALFYGLYILKKGYIYIFV